MIRQADLKIRILVVLGLIFLSIFQIYPLKEKLKLGLDLEGGMYLLLKADTSNLPQDKKATAIEVARAVIRNRIDEFGVKEPDIRLQSSDSLLIQLPGEVDRDKTLKLIRQTAFLEFKLVEEDADKLKSALAGTIPDGYEIAYLEDDPLLIQKDSSITGADLADAKSGFDSNMLPNVSLRLNKEGAAKFAEVTKMNVGKRLAIVLDDKIKSAPVIREPIPSGEAQITGKFTVEETGHLALMLRAGALPCPLILEEERTVGPLLGSDSVRRGINSIILGLAVVALFMIVYYLLGGLIAIICLSLDLLFIFAGLSLFKATLTLPGIAGMILTLGMAVDANVLIFERMREELALGKPLSLSVKNGFDKAKRTIFDANITTLIAALFLFIYGTGPIRGFAVTLSLGIVASIFTAVFIGRTIFSLFLNAGLKRFPMLEIIKLPRINFVRFTNVCLIASFLVIALGMVKFTLLKDEVYGIDFKGGQVLEYKLTPPPDIEEVRGYLKEFEGVTLQEYNDMDGGIIIKSKDDITSGVESILKEKFEKVERLNITTIGPSVGKILKKKALLAVILSIIGILVYVAFRFHHFDFAFAGIIALFHDVLIGLVFLAFFGYELSLLTITALLTIAGYSINDTIVVYDRIRELTIRMHKASPKDIINTAINQTFSRTVITSLTTVMVVVCLYLLGGEALRAFSFTLLVGFIAGTYSSIYIASPLVLLFRTSRRHKR
ncbi:MAG: protein translocase subunit SecD [Candidatus Omnitrophota bacterium]